MTQELNQFPAITTYQSYSLLIGIGFLRDLFLRLFGRLYNTSKGYAPLLTGFEAFYIRRLYDRISDAQNSPIVSRPGRIVSIIERDIHNNLKHTKNIRDCINLGSYNYLGFADFTNSSHKIEEKVLDAVDKYSISTCSTRNSLGTTKLHIELEEIVAKFVGKPAALVFGMGFGVNSTGIPFLIGKGDLILSDEYNHSSIVTGCRASGAKIKVFPHNDTKSLEKIIRKSIVEGQTRLNRSQRRIFIIVEGVYSMEGHACNLKPIVELKKKYKCYLYVDEAHSIGALGKTGRGICEHENVDPNDIDILMGTFTKSFGAVGGYIASSKNLIDFLKRKCSGSIHSHSISPVCCQQIISAFELIQSPEGLKRIEQLHQNSNYFRQALIKMGCHVLGNDDSPVVPVLIINPAKLSAFYRLAFKENLAVVVVGFPATGILDSRVRFCISSSHTKEDLDLALTKLDKIFDQVHLKYKRKFFG